MSKSFKQFLAAVLMSMCAYLWVPRFAEAATCSLKTWSAGNVVLATDLNTNFSCINNALVGLTDSNVAAGAGIQYTKLQYPSNYPKAWASTGGSTSACSTGTCTIYGSRITSVTFVSTGVYTVLFSYTAPNNNYGVVASAMSTVDATCLANALTTTGFTLSCFNSAGSAANGTFTFFVFDDDNV